MVDIYIYIMERSGNEYQHKKNKSKIQVRISDQFRCIHIYTNTVEKSMLPSIPHNPALG